MKIIYFFILTILLFSCEVETPIDVTPPPVQDTITAPIYVADIVLDDLKNNYVSLSKFNKDTVVLSGKWNGDRLVFKDTNNKTLLFYRAFVVSNHAEDAIVVFSSTEKFHLLSVESEVHCGGITFWGGLKNGSISGFKLYYPHTGIRATQDFEHNNVVINDCYIYGASKEGIYWGTHYDSPKLVSNVNIKNCEILYSGWDNYQVGNCSTCRIEDCLSFFGAREDVYGQNYSITVNSGSLFFYDNLLKVGNELTMQVLDSRAFEGRNLKIKEMEKKYGW